MTDLPTPSPAADPFFDEALEKFLIGTARREFWRVKDWYSDVEDLIQDGYMCYYKCRDRYRVVTAKNHPTEGDRKWFMSIFKTAFTRHIRFIIAGKMQHGHEEPVSQLTDDTDRFWDRCRPVQEEAATLATLIAQAPEEIRQLLVVLAGEGGELLGYKRTKLRERKTANGSVRVKRGRRRIRETKNQYYCRLLGLDPKERDIAGLVRRWREQLTES